MDQSLPVMAADVAAIAARCVAESEQRRQLKPEVMEAVLKAGFARHFVPTSCGGSAGTFAELTRAVVAIGEVCASTAWCASLTASMSRMVAFLPEEGYREIWADSPDTLVVGSVTPLGKAVPVDGGWRLSGTWPYISAVEYSDWALLCGVVQDGDRQESKMFAVPRSAYEIRDTWFNVGMQATGSNTVVVEDYFVPTSRAFNREDLFAGRTVDTELSAPCFSAPLLAVNGLSFVVPALGAARGALKQFTEYIANKIRTARPLPGVPGVAGNRTTYEMTVARSAAELDAAQLLLERAADVADQGGAVTPLEVSRNLRDCSVSIDLIVTAVDRMFRAAGTTGQSSTGSLQRFWRDVTSISTHMAIQFEPAARAYTEQLLKI